MPEFFKVVTPSEALQILDKYLRPLVGKEDIPVNSALGRIAAEEIHASCNLPSFPRSTMDGYAVRAADTYGASEGLPAYLALCGEVPMGRAAGLTVGPGQAARV